MLRKFNLYHSTLRVQSFLWICGYDSEIVIVRCDTEQSIASAALSNGQHSSVPTLTNRYEVITFQVNSRIVNSLALYAGFLPFFKVQKLHLQTVHDVDVSRTYNDQKVSYILRAHEPDWLDALVPLRLDQRPRHLETLGFIAHLCIPKAYYVFDARCSKSIFLVYVQRDHILHMTPFRLKEFNERPAMGHVRFLKEGDASFPAGGDKPEAAVLGEETDVWHFRVQYHHVVLFIEYERARVQVVDLHYTWLICHHYVLALFVHRAWC